MAGVITEDYGTSDRSSVTDGLSSDQRCQSGDSIAEWRSSEQVENGTPSTSPLYWDTDDDDDCGPKPSELYGRFTWKIENFSTINKRELRSNAFEVGGYKWYILIYPQGCDVCNHLSLFLCVANHDKLLPGWSHFAQFTIAVVNKDPKKSKYSDTLHRFWKKEHDWGWKKFMELSKVYDGFIVADTLVIKAQVQVIREKSYRPFRCLDCQYRRELVRVYLSNVEQICRRFIEERRDKLKKLIEDKLRWSSFRAFWLGSEQKTRICLSRDNTDAILKVVVKHFFIEKEVTSTLVMDSLYSGLKVLEYQSKNKKGRAQLLDLEELPAPMIRIDKDKFVLADDVLLLLERAASEPLPHQSLPPKDDKSSQNRTKDGSSGEEFNKDSIERDERRLMELGRRTVEIFVLAHIFSSRIEVSYQEFVALKRQEELIREEEAAGQAENELKMKRSANEKEKRSKKKQAKQKRSSRKGKDKVRDERFDAVPDRHELESPSDDKIVDEFCAEKVGPVNMLEDASAESNNGDDVVEAVRADLDDRENSPINWDTDTSEIHPATEASGSDVQNGQLEKRSQSAMDDSSSTCSTDSVPSVVITRTVKGSALPKNKNLSSPNRVKNQRKKETHDRTSSSRNVNSQPSYATVDDCHSSDVSGSNSTRPDSEAVELTLKNEIQQLQKHLIEKDEEVASLQKKLSAKDQVDAERTTKSRSKETSSSSSSGRKPPVVCQQPKQSTETPSLSVAVTSSMAVLASSKEPSSSSTTQTNKSIPLPLTIPPNSTSRSEAQKHVTPAKSTTVNQGTSVSRPSSAPLVPAPKATVPVVSTVQVAPLLSRSVSAAGRLDADPSPSAPSYVPQSYRNAIMGKTVIGASTTGVTNQSVSSSQGMSYLQSPSSFQSSMSMLPPQNSTVQMPGFTFGSVKPQVVHNRHLRREEPHHEATSSSGMHFSDLASDIQRLNIHGEPRKKQYSDNLASKLNANQAQGLVTEEFPHIDIINDLLDEEQNNGRTSKGFHHFFSRRSSFPGHTSALDTGSISGLSRFDQPEQYYDEGFQRTYGSSSSSLHGIRSGHYSQVDLSAYANGHFDGLIQNGWPYGHSDLSMLNLSNRDANGYSYQLPDYTSYPSSGGNGYIYRPANGP